MEDEPAPDPATDGRTRRDRSASDASVVGAESSARHDATESAVAATVGDLREAIVEALRTLPAQSKLVLLAVLARDGRGDGRSTTGEVYNTYERLCADAPLDPLTQRRVSDLLDELDAFGLVSADVVSRGRYGRTREIEGAVESAAARAVLLSDDELGSVASAGGLASDH